MAIYPEHAERRVPHFPELCRYLSERSPQPMVAVDGITHIVSYANPAFAKLVGMEVKDLLHRPFEEVVPEGAENGCLALVDRVFRTGIPENVAEQEHRQSKPRPVYWSYAMWPILDADERPVGVMIEVTDATEVAIFRQQSVAMNESLLLATTRQHQLTEVADAFSARLQAAVHSRDHFLAVLSHELRNPLAAFSSGLELLKLADDDRAVTETARDMMHRQLKHMVRLVDDLLDVSRITSGKLELHKERVELAAVVQDAVEASRPLIDSKGQTLTVVLPPDPVELDADPDRLSQVFLNLLNNAAKYSDPDQRIELTARLVDIGVEVSVRDFGIGISAAVLPDVFRAFMQVDSSWRRAQGGMGIGLSLVKEFVELHGGQVEARSLGAGQGSEFLVRLPLAKGAAVVPPVVAESPHGASFRVLVVDDSRDAAAALKMILRKLGHEVRTAYDGAQAVNEAAEFRPHLVLMDLGMPVMDGYEAARRMRQQPWGSELFLVALTGWGAEEDRRRTEECGFNSHLVKPVDMDHLKRLIAHLPAKAD